MTEFCRSQFLRQLEAQFLRPSPTTITKKRRASTSKDASNNKERNTNKKSAGVIDLDDETTDEVQVTKVARNREGDDFERPRLTQSNSSKGSKGRLSSSPEQPSMKRTNSRLKSAIAEDNRMVVDEDEDTEQNYSQLSNSAGLLLLHSSQKSNKSNKSGNNNNNNKEASRKSRKELSSDNYPSDIDWTSSQDKRNRYDFNTSTESIFVLHPQMEGPLKEAQAVFGDKLMVIDTTTK
ncbi:hypothetical protein HW132_35610 [Brasilonema sp. CT11]|nr:hypothetical protein [Brasilonema sp. CT11]